MDQRSRHRADGRPRLLAHPFNFRPKHCGGTSCTHNHADDGPHAEAVGRLYDSARPRTAGASA